jgi:hypothetical protein
MAPHLSLFIACTDRVSEGRVEQIRAWVDSA